MQNDIINQNNIYQSNYVNNSLMQNVASETNIAENYDNHAPSLPRIERYNPYNIPETKIYPEIDNTNAYNTNTIQQQNISENRTIPQIENQNITPKVVNTAPTTAIPNTNGVNIVIYNPTAAPNGTVYNTTPANQPTVTYPQNYYTMSKPEIPQAATTLGSDNNLNKNKEKEFKATKEKQVVQLTDDYIKTLENYLDNPNERIREMGMKELLARFREDESRKNDIALTALLNKALQDPKSSIRFLALSALDSDYAIGDNLTYQMLNQMQNSKTSYGEDAVMASSILLKTAGNKVNIPDYSQNVNDNNKQEKGEE